MIYCYLSDKWHYCWASFWELLYKHGAACQDALTVLIYFCSGDYFLCCCGTLVMCICTVWIFCLNQGRAFSKFDISCHFEILFDYFAILYIICWRKVCSVSCDLLLITTYGTCGTFCRLSTTRGCISITELLQFTIVRSFWASLGKYLFYSIFTEVWCSWNLLGPRTNAFSLHH